MIKSNERFIPDIQFPTIIQVLLGAWLAIHSLTAFSNPPDWEPVPNLQFNMQVVARLQIGDNNFSVNDDDLIGAFVLDECRGLASPTAALEGLIFLTIGANEVYGETINFKAYLADADSIVDINETLIFEDMAEVGTFLDPFIFTFDANQPPVYHTIISTCDSGGSIDPEGYIQVPEGASQTFTIIADEGYLIADVIVDDTSIGPVPQYTFNDIVANHTIHADFNSIQYIITATAGANGTIYPAGDIVVNQGDSQTFNISAHFGYMIDKVLVDGESVGAVNEYTFSHVMNNHTIHATFVNNTYVITASGSEGGTINPTGDIVVPHGSNQLFTFIPTIHYGVKDVVVDGENMGVLENFEFVNVTNNHTIYVVFDLLENTSKIHNRTNPFKVYPNPTSNHILVDFGITNKNKLQLELINQQGIIVKASVFTEAIRQASIDIHNFPEGLYFLRLTTNDSCFIEKVVIRD